MQFNRGDLNLNGIDLPFEQFLNGGDVLLLASPIAMIDLPSPALHILRACCLNAGIKAEVLYTNLLYSCLIGSELHHNISFDWHLLTGERLFARAAFEDHNLPINYTKDKFLEQNWVPDHIWRINKLNKKQPIPTPVISFRKWLKNLDLKHLESLTTEWVEHLSKKIAERGFSIVGCSTSFGGLLPTISLLGSIKKSNPDIVTILGGPLCEGEMAEGILSLQRKIDYIFSGEGEITFPILIQQILSGELPKEKIICGQEVSDLGKIPVPAYKDYLEQVKKIQPHIFANKKKYLLPFETSRGCWYSKCNFCAMKSLGQAFRYKTPDKVIQNIKEFTARHGESVILLMTDTNMPSQYFKNLIPRLPDEIPPIQIVYEMKANLTLNEILSLRKANIIEFQPGIESLSPSLLKRMNKFQKVRDNIALLRYSRSASVKPRWNLLFGLPGDELHEYKEMLEIIPLIHHLPPPIQMYPLKLSRNSRYHISPKEFNIIDLKPAEVFKDIFPPSVELERIAYYFSGDYPSGARENPKIIQELWEEIEVWSSAWESYELLPLETMLPALQVIQISNGGYKLVDTRGFKDNPTYTDISKEQADLLLVARPLEAVPTRFVQQAKEAGLAVIMETWFVPLATADPTLLLEFESNLSLC